MLPFLKAIPRYTKAVAGGVAAFGTSLGFALADDKVTLGEWAGIVSAVLVAAGVVGGLPNARARR